MNEKQITNSILKYLRSLPECFCWKEHGSAYSSGIPDIICCISGFFVAFEVKTKSGKLTKLQEIGIRRIKDAKGIACKVTSVDEVKCVLDNLEV